jgi:hypothetical protein
VSTAGILSTLDIYVIWVHNFTSSKNIIWKYWAYQKKLYLKNGAKKLWKSVIHQH